MRLSLTACRFALIFLFVWLIGRQWHPYYGFSGFLQIDATMAARAIPAARDDRIFVYRQPGPYDGGFYAQIATDPSLRDPALRDAIDNLGYRARRILLSGLAWAIGGGDPVGAMRAYAWLNIVLWFGLAALLWRVFPVEDWRGTAAWAGVLFGSGVLLSVRLALTDLTALLLVAGAVVLVERNRSTLATALLGVAGLTRETAVLGTAALLPDGKKRSGQGWALPLLPRLVAVALPLALWLVYVRRTAGDSGVGPQNLAWPLTGWWNRWGELWDSLNLHDSTRLQWESILEHIALTVQLIYLAWRPRRECPWWRVGAAYAGLCLCLGGAVWGGLPNAASRVLLPMTLVFNLRVVRDHARWTWLLVGNLSLLAGVHAMQDPFGIAHGLPAGSSWQNRHLLETDSRWSVTEWNSKRHWAWCADVGGLTFHAWPRLEKVRLELELRGISPRTIEVRHAGVVVWRGRVGDRPEWIPLPELPMKNGRLDLELRSDTVSTAEGENNTARSISFACFGARVADDR